MPNETNVNIGNSGEYFVAGELERRGFTVAVPMSNVKDFDILAINRETHEQFAIQVKTTGYKQKKWVLSKNNEELRGNNIFYVFVSLNELETPEYHIVPSKVVADTIKASHQAWLNTPGKKGQQHKDTSIRAFTDEGDTYLNKWELLKTKSLNDMTLPRGIYDSLVSFLPRLKEIKYGEVYPKRQLGDGTIENPYIMPFYAYATVVHEFEDAVYTFVDEHPEFQLNHYYDVLLLEGVTWGIDSMSKADVSHMSGQTIMALMIGAIRAERFCTGALNTFFETGCIEKWLRRLKEIQNLERRYYL